MHEKCCAKLRELFNKYSDNEIIQGKLNNYILNILPLQLENDLDNYNKRTERHDKLLENSREFIEKYLNENSYYYCTNSDIYFKYDGSNYLTYNVDNILHEIYTLINRDENLLPWKQKIKMNIMKEIKDRSIFESIPNSRTIQFVINNLMSLFFNNKNLVKYFLTVLGDIILKKNENYSYIIDSNCKNLIKFLSKLAYDYFGTSSFNSFKYQYHEQQANCRIIFIDKNIIGNRFQNAIDGLITLFNNQYNNNLLDIFLISIHYSNRFDNSDKFLEQCGEMDIINNICLLDNNEKFINKFIDTMFEKCEIDGKYSISSKNMHYLWKLFLKENNIPNIYFLGIFKNLVKKYINYNNETDSYINITSKKLPTISLFIEFWNSTMKYENNSNLYCEGLGLEINEIICLFKYWLNINKHNTIFNVNDNTIIDIINHFFENIIIEEDKYINNIINTLWNKNNDIILFLDYIKSEYLKSNKKNDIQLNNLFNCYCKFSRDNKNQFIVNKIYFEKFICEYLKEFIVNKPNNDKSNNDKSNNDKPNNDKPSNDKHINYKCIKNIWINSI
tara:strand:+ start:5850 stop:7529 length:1680 start_codon:yes stop_codon:yes gene_type:complete